MQDIMSSFPTTGKWVLIKKPEQLLHSIAALYILFMH